MSSVSRTAALVLVAATCVFAAEPAARPTQQQIAQWIRQLGDDDFSTREEASQKLYEAGPAIEAALEQATHGDDPEIVQRANTILTKFRWGLYADAPPEVVAAVNRYRSADLNGKKAVVKELLDSGPPGYRTLFKIAVAETDSTVRTEVYRDIRPAIPRIAPQLLWDGNDDLMELLLDAVRTNDELEGAPYCAAYWLMRGQLDERIAHWKTLAEKGPDAAKNGELLAYLYRAQGDLTAARDAADKAGKPEMADAILFEAGDWKALAGRPVHASSNDAEEALGFQAAFRRLAGEVKGFDDAVAELRKAAAATPDDSDARFYLAKVLLLNDRPSEGLDVLINTPNLQAAAFEMLVAQLRYKEAMELADKVKAANGPETAVLEILKARTLYSLGEKDAAAPIFARYGGQIADAKDAAWPETLIDAELRVGLKDQAADQAAVLPDSPQIPNRREQAFSKLFPKQAEAAATLWVMLRDRSNSTPATAIKDLRALLDGTADPKLLTDLAHSADLWDRLPVPGEVDKRWRALAEAALAAKDETLARSLFEKAGSAAALIRLGDLDA